MASLSPNTKSTCTTETVRREHRFDIADYSSKLAQGPGTVLTSDTFAVGGFHWAICFYPNEGDKDEAYASVFVRILTENAIARALFDLRLLDRAGGSPRSVRRIKIPAAFVASNAKKRQRGAREFMGRTELAASPYLRDDRLTVECVLDVVQEPWLTPTTAVSPEIVEPPPTDLWKHLGQLMLTQDGTDVAFDVQGEAFDAHRFVLAARSPVFKAELSGSPSPSSNQLEDTSSEMMIVTINDIRPPVFKVLLHFIYTNTLPCLDDELGADEFELVLDLLKAADRYAMKRLKEICALILWKGLDAKTVVAECPLLAECFYLVIGQITSLPK